jgi:tRNA uridine 5-carboxymethylaminomethyl modification enzyme
MIDDLVVQGISEPYRMFTSRAEYRLSLRADNADQRLTGRGMALGCVSTGRAEAFGRKLAGLAVARVRLESLRASPSVLYGLGFAVNRDGVARSALQLLAYPDVSLERLGRVWPELRGLPPDIAEQIEIEARYAGYLDRQEADIHAFRRDETLELPRELDYATVGGLSNELREKLSQTNPATLGAAARIPGITPAALTALLRYVRRSEGRHRSAA